MCVFIGPRLPAAPHAIPPDKGFSARLTATCRYRHRMRPFTAIVVIGLLVLIVGAFVAKLIGTGLTP